MVISNLLGGLGNQMFQYAAGRALSLQQGQTLLLDISDYSGYDLHQGFELNRIFDCALNLATESDVRSILGWQSSVAVRRLLKRPAFSIFRRKGFVVEPYFHYWQEINSVPCECYLTGYWQSEKYFNDAASQIRSDFTFKPDLGKENAELGIKINQVNAVSLHVRRGDYANNPTTTAAHGLCSIEYYLEAIRYVAQRVQQPHFFIFSDDIPWVKKNLKIDFPHQFVEHNKGAESYNDMRMMSMCDHHIIANSSFSWWGAWLNSDPDKIVIAPKRWFGTNVDVKDLLPKEWIKM